MSKIAVISDIHSNPKALRRVLDDIKTEKCDEIVCLGDVVGYGYDPNECIRMITEDTCDYPITFILGNHDAALCNKLPLSWFSETAAAGIKRQTKIISDESRLWLTTLPYTKRTTNKSKDLNIFYAHGSYVPEESFYSSDKEMFPYMTGSMVVHTNINKMSEYGDTGIMFVGHTHERCLFHLEREYFEPEDYNKFFDNLKIVYDVDDANPIDISSGYTIVNVGSVGYPRNEPYISYAILDDEKKEVKYRKLRFFLREYVKDMTDRDIKVPRWMDRWYSYSKDRYIDEEDSSDENESKQQKEK